MTTGAVVGSFRRSDGRPLFHSCADGGGGGLRAARLDGGGGQQWAACSPGSVSRSRSMPPTVRWRAGSRWPRPCRAGRGRRSTWWWILPPMCSCRPMRSPRAGCCRPASAPPAGVLVVVTGALYFADRAMKTPDNYFRGFPALWNVAAFYLLLLRPAPVPAAACVAALAVMTFVPFPFIHPLRVRRYRAFNHCGARPVGRAGGRSDRARPDAAGLGHRRLVPDRRLCCLRRIFPDQTVSDPCSTS